MGRGVAAVALGGGLALAHARSRGRTRRVQGAVAVLDPVADAREVVWQLSTRDFGWDVETALSFALFRTYAVPSISVLLAATGEFTERARKRFDDTELVLSEINKHGLDEGRGRQALRRMNAMHAAFDIDPADTLYTLTTFVCEPVRWAERFGWRPMTPHEIAGWTAWYRALGQRMGLSDLPVDYPGFDALNRRYEAEHFRFHPANRAVADASVQLFLEMYAPRALHGLGEVAIRAMMDRPLLDALGYEPAPPGVVRTVEAAMRARATVQRHLLPERRTDWDLTLVERPSYPDGYAVEDLGTFPDTALRQHANGALATLRAAAPR